MELHWATGKRLKSKQTMDLSGNMEIWGLAGAVGTAQVSKIPWVLLGSIEDIFLLSSALPLLFLPPFLALSLLLLCECVFMGT